MIIQQIYGIGEIPLLKLISGTIIGFNKNKYEENITISGRIQDKKVQNIEWSGIAPTN